MSICTRPDCTAVADLKSTKGYCREHKRQARAAWRDTIAASREASANRAAGHAELFDRAWRAGVAAAAECVPTPMVVEQHASPLDDASPVVQSWHVPQGVCGFASVVIRPGNSSFALWLKKTHRTYRHYYGGVNLPIHDYGQSYEVKVAHAQAMCAVLKAAGINATVDSRLD